MINISVAQIRIQTSNKLITHLYEEIYIKAKNSGVLCRKLLV